MLHKLSPMRHWHTYAFIGVPILLALVMFYTGFASDIGTAILSRLLGSDHGSGNIFYHGPTSLEERIVGSDVIARVRLLSVSSGVEAVGAQGNHDKTVYVSSLKFRFEVLEYLKGTGGGELVAVVFDQDDEYETSLGASTLGKDLSDGRDTRWDDREAIVFLVDSKSRRWLPLSTQEADRYTLAIVWRGEDRYTIASRYNKYWLPAASPIGAVGVSGKSNESVGGQQFFFMDEPEEPGTQATSAKHPELSTPSAPTIALAELKARIVELEREVSLGDGSEEYRRCVIGKYAWEREVRYNIEIWGPDFYHESHGYDIASGLPAGSKVFEDRFAGYRAFEAHPIWREVFWLEGKDSDLFDANWPGMVYSARPLPAGEYMLYYNGRLYQYIICDAYPEQVRNSVEHFVTVTAPDGTLHEAFFDPVEVGSTVGADDSNGVLKPASFEAEGGVVTIIGRIEWESQQVRMEFSPSAPPSGHHVDFIALDGTVALQLKIDDATVTVDGGGTALSWGVCSQPWETGDKLMLRISENAPDLTGATNDTECPSSGQ